MRQATIRAVRTLAQMIAAGGLTALVSALTNGLSAETAVTVMIGWAAIVTYVHNLLEDMGVVPSTRGDQ